MEGSFCIFGFSPNGKVCGNINPNFAKPAGRYKPLSQTVRKQRVKMNNGNKISELESELKLKQNEISKLKNAKMKLLSLLIICTFLIPFIPLKKGSLNDQYGYWGGVLFTSVITFGITPLLYFLVLESEEKAVTELKRKIDQERRLNELKKDDND